MNVSIILKVEALAKSLAVAVGRYLLFKGVTSTSRASDRVDSFFVGKVLASGITSPHGYAYFAEDYVIGAPVNQQYVVPSNVELFLRKPLSDACNGISSVSTQAGKPFAEVYDITDSADVGLNKTNEDVGFAIQERVKYFAEDYVVGGVDYQTYAGTEFVPKLVGKYLDTTAQGVDSINIVATFDRLLADVAAPIATISNEVGKPFAEVYDVTDSIEYFGLNKTNEDVGFVYDDVLPPPKFVAKFFTDAAVSSEGIDGIIISDADEAVALSEPFSSADFGMLRSQNYLDYSYIESDYVGISRTF